MTLNSVGMTPLTYSILQDSQAVDPSLNKNIENRSWALRSEQIQYIIRKIYSLAIGFFQKIKGLGVKIGHQIRVAVVYIDRAIVFNIQIQTGDHHHHHYPKSRKEVQSLQPVEIKKDESQKCEEELPQESTLAEPKKIDLLYKAGVQPSLAQSNTPKKIFSEVNTLGKK